jgi:FkbM family methyltransferase
VSNLSALRRKIAGIIPPARRRDIRGAFTQPVPTLVGGLREAYVNLTGRPIIFRDQDGFRYWRYPGDQIIWNHQVRAVGDSASVRNYILNRMPTLTLAVDIGSCVGSVSMPLWRIAASPAARVISIDADPGNAERTRENLRLNGFRDDLVINAAITDTDGTVQLRRYLGKNGWQTLGDPHFAKDVPSELIDVAARRLQSVLAAYSGADPSTGPVDVIKLDVEGWEPTVLRSIRSLLCSGAVKRLIFEVNHLMLDGTGWSVADLLSIWADLPYRLFVLRPDGTPEPLAKGQAWPEGEIGDCLAVCEAEL